MLKANNMNEDDRGICVYYDGACPRCIKDRETYKKLAGKSGDNVYWVDITGQEQRLYDLGIDPKKALTELHVMDETKLILSELDAYILLMSKVPALRPVAWLIGLPLIRPILSNIYHAQVNRRLRKSGRL